MNHDRLIVPVVQSGLGEQHLPALDSVIVAPRFDLLHRQQELQLHGQVPRRGHDHPVQLGAEYLLHGLGIGDEAGASAAALGQVPHQGVIEVVPHADGGHIDPDLTVAFGHLQDALGMTLSVGEEQNAVGILLAVVGHHLLVTQPDACHQVGPPGRRDPVNRLLEPLPLGLAVHPGGGKQDLCVAVEDDQRHEIDVPNLPDEDVEGLFHPFQLVLGGHRTAVVDHEGQVHRRQLFEGDLGSLDADLHDLLLPGGYHLAVAGVEAHTHARIRGGIVVVDRGDVGVHPHLLPGDDQAAGGQVFTPAGGPALLLAAGPGKVRQGQCKKCADDQTKFHDDSLLYIHLISSLRTKCCQSAISIR